MYVAIAIAIYFVIRSILDYLSIQLHKNHIFIMIENSMHIHAVVEPNPHCGKWKEIRAAS